MDFYCCESLADASLWQLILFLGSILNFSGKNTNLSVKYRFNTLALLSIPEKKKKKLPVYQVQDLKILYFQASTFLLKIGVYRDSFIPP